MIALVVGGAECVWDDLDKAEQFPVEYTYLITNSMIAYLNRPGVAVTLHPRKVAEWLDIRRINGLCEPQSLFAQSTIGNPRGNAQVFRLTWRRGSVALYAVEVARKYFSCERILLCGCPMTEDGGHFERRKPWTEAAKFREGWTAPRQELAPYVRSMSGWTREQFGEPTMDWLNGRH